MRASKSSSSGAVLGASCALVTTAVRLACALMPGNGDARTLQGARRTDACAPARAEEVV